ncbi:MAG: dihydroneopterin aldolase [Candidatus Comchoanobacterales bacterium]
MILHLKGLSVELRLGVTEAERSSRQAVYIDLSCQLPQGAALDDNIEKTIDYDHLSRCLFDYFYRREVRLIEHLAMMFKQWWLTQYPNVPMCFVLRKIRPNSLIQEAQIEDSYDWKITS